MALSLNHQFYMVSSGIVDSESILHLFIHPFTLLSKNAKKISPLNKVPNCSIIVSLSDEHEIISSNAVLEFAAFCFSQKL